eukprot:11080368-Ditylum_brightwellii.AAC.1
MRPVEPLVGEGEVHPWYVSLLNKEFAVEGFVAQSVMVCGFDGFRASVVGERGKFQEEFLRG